MRSLKLTAQAKQDLKNLSQYTRREWGEEQLGIYRQQLKEAFNRLIALPEIGKPRDDVRKGYRCLPVAKHVIFYRITQNAIEIIAIPHSRRDPFRYVNDASASE